MGKIAVIGDVMLDVYNYCKNRENPESSAPCYTVVRIESKPGGAGNVAVNLAKLGSEVILLGVVGEDDYGRILSSSLNTAGVPNMLLQDKERHTIVKQRIIAASDGRYHFRFDIETNQYLNVNHTQELLKNIEDASLIVVSDYAKGTVTKEGMEKLKKMKIPVIADPKPVHKEWYRGLFMITPNSKEARDMAGESDDIKAAKILRDTLETRVLLTRSEKGVSFFGLKGERFNFPAKAKKVFDVTGAGDTVVATFAHFFNKGKSVRECIRLANKAAGISVGFPGCYAVSEEELL